jgi:predicted nucleic acid-binding protein
MSDRYFVDTKILMYAHDSAAGEKHEKAKVLRRWPAEPRSSIPKTCRTGNTTAAYG